MVGCLVTPRITIRGVKLFFSLPWQTEKGLVTTVQDLKNRTHYASALRLRFSPRFLRSHPPDNTTALI
jgi:hypothetical protein